MAQNRGIDHKGGGFTIDAICSHIKKLSTAHITEVMSQIRLTNPVVFAEFGSL